MEVESLIRSLECDGAVFELVGERIKLRAKSEHAPAPEQLAHLRRHRAEVIALLRLRQPNDNTFRRQLNETMRRICTEQYTPGMIDWLQRAHSELHQKITRTLPEEIERLCELRVQPEVFQAALDYFSETHRMARELYEESAAVQEKASGLNGYRKRHLATEGQDENSH